MNSDNFAKDGNSILRPIHYPPITSEPANAIRSSWRYQLDNLINGGARKGLQVQNHDEDWIDAIAEPDELVINVGDMLSRYTNNKLKSTIQVVNPPRENFVIQCRFYAPCQRH
jgi:isopenicillin N synthase-like dioxygenase